MTLEAFATIDQDGVLSGPMRRPENFSKNAKGSIHDDATAQTLGFRGGTVAGNIHHEQFPPLLDARFGPGWLKRGGISLFFMNATTDGEPVQAHIGAIEDVGLDLRRAPTWMETPEGVRVMEGTAWIGGDDPGSALRKRVASARPATDLRILKASKVGDTVRDIPSRLKGEIVLPRLAAITEPRPEYTDPAIYGERVAAPSVAIDALRAVEVPLFMKVENFVGMFGAIELQYVDGPIFVDHDYLVDAQVLALSESPKTEVAWFESTLKDAADGRIVAKMIMMTRLLKGSSPLWG